MKAPETVVTQEDRDAAEEWRLVLNHCDYEGEGDPVADLAADFARHREQAITALQAELASARKVVEECRDTFAHYTELHAAKLPPDTAKSRANQDKADLCSSWLTANGGE